MKKRRRRLMVFHLGNPRGRPYDSPKPVEMLKRAHNLKVKILKTCLTGVSRAAVDVSKMEGLSKTAKETVLSLVGCTYSSVQKISMYAFREDEELIKVIIKGCDLHILDPDELPQMLK